MLYPFPPRCRAWMCLVFTHIHNLIDDSWLSHSLKIPDFEKGDGVDMCKNLSMTKSFKKGSPTYYIWMNQPEVRALIPFFDWFISWSYQGKYKADREFCSSLTLFSMFTWQKIRVALGYAIFSACIWRIV